MKDLDEEIIAVEEEKTVRDKILEDGESAKDYLIEVIKNGEVIRDAIVDDERIVVTSTPNGFGYMVFDNVNDTEPCYYALGSTYVKDLAKNDDLNGVALRYPGGKSRIQRNLAGFSLEYIPDPNFRALYMSYNNPPGSEIVMSQHMVGYNPQDAVTVFGYNFRQHEVWVACGAQLLAADGRPDNLRVVVGGLTDDGEINYQPIMDFARYANEFNKLPGDVNGFQIAGPATERLEEEHLTEVVREAAVLGQSTFFPIYSSMGIPTFAEAKYNGLLEKFTGSAQMTGFLTEAQPSVTDSIKK